MLISFLSLLVISAVLGEPEVITMSTITSTTSTSSVAAIHDQELQTEESRVLRKPENATLPLNHSETLRAMPTQQTKTQDVASTSHQNQQITKPSPSASSPAVLNITAATDVGRLKDFRPSPQLEPIYEYNHFPVEPAHPEAKHFFGTSIKIPIHSTLSHVYDAEPTQQQQQQQYGQDEKDVWGTKMVRFPHAPPTAVTVNDHPYPYMKDAMDKGSPLTSGSGVGITTGLAQVFGGGGGGGAGYHNKDAPVLKRPIMQKYAYGDNWENSFKHDYKPPSKTYHEEHAFNTDLTSSPWKKIIKILTAFIPIGLLLSALTPSIITIGPMNATTVRARSNSRPKSALLTHLALDGCDERIFCELMLSAEETGNNDKNVESMIENYIESHGNSTRLQLIYKAIKDGNCSTLHCNSIKD